MYQELYSRRLLWGAANGKDGSRELNQLDARIRGSNWSCISVLSSRGCVRRGWSVGGDEAARGWVAVKKLGKDWNWRRTGEVVRCEKTLQDEVEVTSQSQTKTVCQKDPVPTIAIAPIQDRGKNRKA